MTVGNRVFSGKGAREESATALTFAILTWRDDQSLQSRGVFRGFEILSKGKTGGFGLLQDDERIPDVFVRGRTTYCAKLNPVNPVGTIQSVEHTLRNRDKLADDQQSRVAWIEKELVDYQAQAERPFEHEERLKQLLTRQAELNSALDLDKGDQQGADSAPETEGRPGREPNPNSLGTQPRSGREDGGGLHARLEDGDSGTADLAAHTAPNRTRNWPRGCEG